MGSTLALLGVVEEFRGGQIAEIGHWLVVFKNNRPHSLYDTGRRVRRLFQVPVIGTSVAQLNTMPQDFHHEVRNVKTGDGYTVPWVKVHCQVRLTPEAPGAIDALMEMILRDGVRFTEVIESRLRRTIEGHVRGQLRSRSADEVLSEGLSHVLFRTDSLPLGRPEVEVTAIPGVDWEESLLAGEVREARERDIAERSKEQLDRAARERAATARAHQLELDAAHSLSEHAIEAELSRRNLDLALQRAKALGIDPIAIAEPEVWRQIASGHADVLTKLLESPQLYPVLRNNPDLMRAIIGRLGGGTPPTALTRQADMVLDGLSPERVVNVPDATVFSEETTDEYLSRAGLVVHPDVASCWGRAGGDARRLNGAGYAVTLQGKSAIVLLVGLPEPAAPATFSQVMRLTLAAAHQEVGQIGVYSAPGETLADAVGAFVRKIADDVEVKLVLRQRGEQREALAELSGPANSTAAVLKVMTDPANPILPALESLVGNRAQIRFTTLRG